VLRDDGIVPAASGGDSLPLSTEVNGDTPLVAPGSADACVSGVHV
jgi:hypothetical protein